MYQFHDWMNFTILSPMWSYCTNAHVTLTKLYFHFLSYWMGYDRGDSFPFNFEPNRIPFGWKSKGKLSPRSYPIQCERKWNTSFLSVRGTSVMTIACQERSGPKCNDRQLCDLGTKESNLLRDPYNDIDQTSLILLWPSFTLFMWPSCPLPFHFFLVEKIRPKRWIFEYKHDT